MKRPLTPPPTPRGTDANPVTSTSVTDIDTEMQRLRFQLHESLCSIQARMALAKEHRISLEITEAKFPELLNELSMHKRDMEYYEGFLHSHQTSLRQCVAITSLTQELLRRGVVPNEVLLDLLQAVEAIYEILRKNAGLPFRCSRRGLRDWLITLMTSLSEARMGPWRSAMVLTGLQLQKVGREFGSVDVQGFMVLDIGIASIFAS